MAKFKVKMYQEQDIFVHAKDWEDAAEKARALTGIDFNLKNVEQVDTQVYRSVGGIIEVFDREEGIVIETKTQREDGVWLTYDVAKALIDDLQAYLEQKGAC